MNEVSIMMSWVEFPNQEKFTIDACEISKKMLPIDLTLINPVYALPILCNILCLSSAIKFYSG